MSKIKELLKSPHIQIASAAGASIIILAYVSKRILPQPMAKIPMAIPPFLMVIYESLYGKYKNTRLCTTWYWVVAISAATALVIGFHLI